MRKVSLKVAAESNSISSRAPSRWLGPGEPDFARQQGLDGELFAYAHRAVAALAGTGGQPPGGQPTE
jgi:hypothetical protein